jgi:hypothetical protein
MIDSREPEAIHGIRRLSRPRTLPSILIPILYLKLACPIHRLIRSLKPFIGPCDLLIGHHPPRLNSSSTSSNRPYSVCPIKLALHQHIPSLVRCLPPSMLPPASCSVRPTELVSMHTFAPCSEPKRYAKRSPRTVITSPLSKGEGKNLERVKTLGEADRKCGGLRE